MLGVPETVLQDRETEKELRRATVKATAKYYQKISGKRDEIFRRAMQYTQDYMAAERAEVRAARLARAKGSIYVPAEPKLLLVVRIRGIANVNHRCRKILRLLRLFKIHSAVFVRANASTLAMLRIIDPYVTWGAPTVGTVRALLYKRGFCRVKGNRVPLSDNYLIEQALGQYNLICLEDLVHELVTVGPHFSQANRFLSPFALRPPSGGYRFIKRHYVEG